MFRHAEPHSAVKSKDLVLTLQQHPRLQGRTGRVPIGRTAVGRQELHLLGDEAEGMEVKPFRFHHCWKNHVFHMSEPPY